MKNLNPLPAGHYVSRFKARRRDDGKIMEHRTELARTGRGHAIVTIHLTIDGQPFPPLSWSKAGAMALGKDLLTELIHQGDEILVWETKNWDTEETALLKGDVL